MIHFDTWPAKLATHNLFLGLDHGKLAAALKYGLFYIFWIGNPFSAQIFEQVVIRHMRIQKRCLIDLTIVDDPSRPSFDPITDGRMIACSERYHPVHSNQSNDCN